MGNSHHFSDWTVDYGDGRPPIPVRIPHVWGQEMPVSEEGPVTYRASVELPTGNWLLRFHGVSYLAEVFLDGEPVGGHKGIWDAFDVPVSRKSPGKAQLEVRVTKNGGPTFPVKEVLSGFLPYVFHTFGGIFREVELVESEDAWELPAQRISVDERKLLLDGRPFYMRGVLHWGWYPQLGHPNPCEELILEEVRAVKRLGFNLVKFCLWLPPHRYLDILEQEGMVAWIELPLWDPAKDPEKQFEMANEVERIVRQYRRHSCVVAWTCGCELGASTSPGFRNYLTQMVQNLTGCPLVKDSSGGAEMYGGDLREFGTFYDFHPYCDTQFFPAVLDTLLPGARPSMPTLLGEFNDIDLHRDLAKLGDELPYWASSLPELNAIGVRWQHDLPRLVSETRFAEQPTANGHKPLMESSRRKAAFIRKTVQEAVRSRDQISGYVATVIRDTPISTSGFFDDWGRPRFTEEECRVWNSGACLFLMPARNAPWIDGGNRPGFSDPLNFFAGPVFLRIGCHTEEPMEFGLVWRILDERGERVVGGAEAKISVPAMESTQVAQLAWEDAVPGEYRLEVEFGGAESSWPLWIVPGKQPLSARLYDPAGLLRGLAVDGNGPLIATAIPADESPDILFLTGDATVPMPFWRESCYQFPNEEFWAVVPFRERWERLLSVSTDRTVDTSFFREPYAVLMNRIDTRTYAEHPVLAKAGSTLVTTLRPWGGLGYQPIGIGVNPAGYELVRGLLRSAS
ncbi:MAG TPA: hypothetical protein VG944_05905 [Fimbriimonas sp.]|nr:hypothetical protein [Fimbriimonas sp.]